jgi:hypothetical protein
MNETQKIFEKMYDLLEVTGKKRFTLKRETPGTDFDVERPVKIPPGEYIVVDSDDRNSKRVVISNVKNFNLYALDKKQIKIGE